MASFYSLIYFRENCMPIGTPTGIASHFSLNVFTNVSSCFQLSSELSFCTIGREWNWDPTWLISGTQNQLPTKGILSQMGSAHLTLSWLVNHRTVRWKESQPIPILQTGDWSPSLPLPEWNRRCRASCKSEDEDPMLRRGLRPQWLPWTIVSALGCLPLRGITICLV